MFVRSLFLATIVAAIISTASAFSSGAAGCIGDDVVGGPHVDSASKPVTVVPWAQSKLVLKVNGKKFSPGSTISVPVNAQNVIEISGGEQFKGFLFRFTKPGDYEGLEVIPTIIAQNAVNCGGVTLRGLTHQEASPKKKADGKFVLKSIVPEGDDPIELKIVVVYQNQDTGAKHTKSDYIIKATPPKPCKPKKCTAWQNLWGCTSKFCN
jgi:hypothetical protein